MLGLYYVFWHSVVKGEELRLFLKLVHDVGIESRLHIAVKSGELQVNHGLHFALESIVPSSAHQGERDSQLVAERYQNAQPSELILLILIVVFWLGL